MRSSDPTVLAFVRRGFSFARRTTPEERYGVNPQGNGVCPQVAEPCVFGHNSTDRGTVSASYGPPDPALPCELCFGVPVRPAS